MIDHQKTQLYFFLLLFLIIFALTISLFLPFLSLLVLMIALAVAIEPIHKKILSAFGHPSFSSFLTIIITAVVLLIPFYFIANQLFIESRNLYFYFSNNQTVVTSVTAAINHFIQTTIQPFWPNASLEINQYLRQILGSLVNNLGGLLSSTVTLILHLFLALFSFYFIIKDGPKFLKKFIELSPLNDRYDEEIIAKLKNAINSVMRGTIFIALIQGLVAGIGLTIFNVPNGFLWGSLAVISALVPTIGTGLVMVPSVIYLFLTGQIANAVGLAIWALLIVSFIDNLLTPFIYSRGTKTHPFFLLFSVLGGISVFGPLGFLLGPLLVNLFFALLDIYRLLVLGQKTADKKRV